jgi:hypothetical protein
MDDKKWERYAALGGVIFVIANVVSAAATGEPPAPDDPPADIAKYFADKSGALKLSQVLGGIAAIALIWWFGSLWRRMNRAENDRPRLAIVSLIGLTFGGALFMASSSIWAAAALRSDSLGDNAPIYFTLGSVLLAASGFGLAVHLAATCALAWRTKMLPTWIAGLGMLSALGFLLAGIIGSSSDAMAGLLFGFIGFIAWSVWVLAVSFVMWSTSAAEVPATAGVRANA